MDQMSLAKSQSVCEMEFFDAEKTEYYYLKEEL